MNTAMTVQQSGALAALKGAMPGLQRARQSIPHSAGGDYLKNGKDGIWTVGQDEQVIGSDVNVVVNSLSLMNGYVCWTNYDGGRKNEKMGEEMSSLNAPPINAAALPEQAFAWRPQQSVRAKFASGPLAGREAIWVTSSVGGLGAMGGLIDAIMARVDSGKPDVFPIVNLSSKSYPHKSYGKIYNPVLNIVGWATVDGPDDEEADNASAPAEASNATASEAIAASQEAEAKAPADAPAEEPVRRRRRSAV